MPYDPDQHHRRSIRLSGYDYATPGAYFITICTQHRACVLGTIDADTMYPNAAGEMTLAVWHSLPERFPCVALDAFVVMPNHVHGLIVIAENATPMPEHAEGMTAPCASLGAVVGAWKSLTTQGYLRGIHDCGWPCFDNRLWQRNYWEHIVRDDAEMQRLRRYILTNPSHWQEDQLHPAAPSWTR